MIVGAGEVGFHIASRLAMENKDVVIVDSNQSAIRRVSENLDVQTVVGSGSSPAVLKEAGIIEADILLAVTDSDEINLVACLVADKISNGTKKLARLRNADYDEYYDDFSNGAPGINTFINPDVEVVNTIEKMITVPGAADVSEFADGRMKFIGIYITENSDVKGLRLFDLPKRTNNIPLLVAAIIRKEKLIVPRGDDRLLAGDLIYLICEASRVADVFAVFNREVAPIKRLMIIGGGRIGFRLAKRLETKPVNVKLVEMSEERCDFLAEHLDRTLVLCGDGSDQNLLMEENIADMDMVVAITNDEETNILSSLLAKRMGAKKNITMINKFSYFPLMNAIGIEQVVSPRLSAINSILQHIRKGKVISTKIIKGEQAEVMEAEALETSEIVGKPLKKIDFPRGALLIGIIRGEDAIIPSGDSVIQPKDRIIIFSSRKAIPKVEKILTVKLEFV